MCMWVYVMWKCDVGHKIYYSYQMIWFFTNVLISLYFSKQEDSCGIRSVAAVVTAINTSEPNCHISDI